MALNSVLIVCMGNICRSPTAEAVLRARTQSAGLSITIDSAGTIAHHVGSKADPRAIFAGEKRGYSFKGIKARQVKVADFRHFDLILAADEDNLRDLMAICPKDHQHKVKLFLSFLNSDIKEIPDPYYGGAKGFELVLDLVELGADALLIQTFV